MAKKHWKEVSALASQYLGGVDLLDDNGKYQDKTVTIKTAKETKIVGEKGREDICLVVEFTDKKLKPWIVNKINSKTIEKLSGTGFYTEWAGTDIILYFDPTVRFGSEVTGGVRVRNYAPKKCGDCGKAITDTDKATANQIAAGTKKTYGKELCYDCADKRART